MVHQVNQEVRNAILDSDEIMFRIATTMRKRFRTVYGWAQKNDPMLASPAVLDILKKDLGLSEKQIVEEVKDCAPV